MRIIDISRTLNPAIAVWPGDTPFSLQQILDIGRGDVVNLTTLTLSAHTGTHVDAPYHFLSDGAVIDALDLALYWGPAQVITVKKRSGPLHPEDFAHVDFTKAARLLVRSAASSDDPTIFDPEIVYPSPALAEALGHAKVLLYGSDAPSMDAADSKTLPGHKALHRSGIAILEGLDLSKAPDGFYELVAIPLKIAGGDGSPVRAVLRSVG